MHAYIPGKESRRRGSAMVTLMVVVLLVSIAGAAMVSFAKQQAFAVTKIRDNLKAQSYAEAGVNEAYNAVKTAFATASDPSQFPAMTFGDGSYDVTVTMVGDDRASIVSVGECGGSTITVKADVKNMLPATPGTGGGGYQPVDPFAYTWLANGQVRMNGSSEFGGFVHANNDIDVNGSSDWGTAAEPVFASATVGIRFSGVCTLYGEMKAPSVSGSFSPGAVVVAPSPLVPIPTLDFTALYNTALANGQVVGSQSVNANKTWNIPGGVKWINGTLSVANNKTLTYSGCIVVTGDINMKQNATLNATPIAGLPTLVSRDGNMTMGHGQTAGLLWAKGDITFSGGADFTGTIICGGNLLFNGSGSRFTYTDYGFGAGGGSSTPGSTADHVVITAWQQ